MALSKLLPCDRLLSLTSLRHLNITQALHHVKHSNDIIILYNNYIYNYYIIHVYNVYNYYLLQVTADGAQSLLDTVPLLESLEIQCLEVI